MKQLLEEEIESMRKELIMTARKKGLAANETIKKSEELDCLINGYNSLRDKYLTNFEHE